MMLNYNTQEKINRNWVFGKWWRYLGDSKARTSTEAQVFLFSKT